MEARRVRRQGLKGHSAGAPPSPPATLSIPKLAWHCCQKIAPPHPSSGNHPPPRLPPFSFRPLSVSFPVWLPALEPPPYPFSSPRHCLVGDVERRRVVEKWMEPGWATPRSSAGKTSLDIFEGVSVANTGVATRTWMPANLSAPPQRSTRTRTSRRISFIIGVASGLGHIWDWFRPRGWLHQTTPANKLSPSPAPSDLLLLLLLNVSSRSFVSVIDEPVIEFLFRVELLYRVREENCGGFEWDSEIEDSASFGDPMLWWDRKGSREISHHRGLEYFIYTQVAFSPVLLICDLYTLYSEWNERLTVTALYYSMQLKQIFRFQSKQTSVCIVRKYLQECPPSSDIHFSRNDRKKNIYIYIFRCVKVSISQRSL